MCVHGTKYVYIHSVGRPTVSKNAYVRAAVLLKLCQQCVSSIKIGMESAAVDKVKFFEVRLLPSPNTSVFVNWHVCNVDRNVCVYTMVCLSVFYAAAT